jgi:hypothetical protein
VRRHRRLSLLSVLIGVSASTIAAAELGEAAGRAYAEYLGQASRSFLDRLNQPPGGSDADHAALQAERTIVGPVHHWRGAIFIPGVTLDQAISVSRTYRDYPNIFRPIIASTVLADEGDFLRVQFRIRESAAGMTVILDVRSTIRYVRIDARRAYDISSADEILEVKVLQNQMRSTEAGCVSDRLRHRWDASSRHQADVKVNRLLVNQAIRSGSSRSRRDLREAPATRAAAYSAARARAPRVRR